MKNTSSSIKIIESDCETRVHPGLKVFFGYNLYKAGMIYRSIMDTRHLYKYQLTAPECGLLYVLSTGSIVNQLSLGQELGIDKATIVKMIDKMETLKLVKRDVDPDDRRSKIVSLTAKGNATLEKVKAIRSEIEGEVLGNFSKEDQTHLRRLVPELLEALLNVKK